jgi:transcriptional regulator of arginine metabolism
VVDNHLLERHEALKKIIAEVLISDQNTLVHLLKEKFGIETNQSILSRDLRKLGIVKKETDKGLYYTLPDSDVIAELLKIAIIDIRHNEAIIVLKTYPGLAAFVGDYIDQEATDLPILGCLAGENVVFVTCQSTKNTEEVYEALCQKIHIRKHLTPKS